MKGVVTNRQYFFLLLFVLTGYSIVSLPKTAFLAAGTGAWFSILTNTAIFAAGIFLLAALNKVFEGKTIYEYAQLLVGKAGAVILCIFYGTFFLFVTILIFRDIAEFIKGCYLPLTPIWVLLVLSIGVAFYMAYKGITNIGRFCELFGVFYLIISILVYAAMILKGDPDSIKPFLNPEKIKDYVLGAKNLIVPFLGYEILTVVPFGKINRKKGVSALVWGLLFIGFYCVLVTEAATMTIGRNNVTYYNDTIVEALRITQLPRTFLLERADFVFLMIGNIGILTSLCIFSYTTVEFACKLFTKKSRNTLLLSIAFGVFIASNFIINAKSATFLFKNVLPYWGIFTALVIPLILFILAKVKKHAKSMG